MKYIFAARAVLVLGLAILFLMLLFYPAAAQEESGHTGFIPEIAADEKISSLEGWEQVEDYWHELETEVGEFLPAWDIKDVWKRDEDGIAPGASEILKGLFRYLFREVMSNFGLLGHLILLAVAAALLKSLQGAFGSEEVARLTEAVAFYSAGTALKSFSVALEIGRSTVDSMVNFMLAPSSGVDYFTGFYGAYYFGRFVPSFYHFLST